MQTFLRTESCVALCFVVNFKIVLPNVYSVWGDRFVVFWIAILTLLHKRLKLFLLGLSDAVLCWYDVFLIILAKSSDLNIGKICHSSSRSWDSSHYTSAILDIPRDKQQFCFLSHLTDPQAGPRPEEREKCWLKRKFHTSKKPTSFNPLRTSW